MKRMKKLGLVVQKAEAGGLQGQRPLGFQSEFKVSVSNFVRLFQNKREKRPEETAHLVKS